MCAISTVPFCTASAACRPGTISPAAKVWIWNLLSVASATAFENTSQAPKMVSSDFGKLDVRRHFSSGLDCAIAGLAIAVAARPRPAAPINCRRFIFRFLYVSGEYLQADVPKSPCAKQVGDGMTRATAALHTCEQRTRRARLSQLLIPNAVAGCAESLSLDHDLRRGATG